MAVPVAQLVKHLEDCGILAGGTLKDFIPPKASPKDAEELLREPRNLEALVRRLLAGAPLSHLFLKCQTRVAAANPI